MKLIDEKNDVLGTLDLVHHRLDALFELAAVFRARDHQGEVEGDDLLVAEQLGHVAGSDLLGEALGDGSLSDTGFADEDRIVFGPAAKDLDDPFDLAAASDHGIEFAPVGEFGKVASEGFQRGRLAFLAIAAVAGLFEIAFLVVGGVAGEIRIELAEDLVAGALDVDVEILENTSSHTVALTEKAEEDVLGPDVAVIQGLRLFPGEGENLLDPWRVGDVPDHLGLGPVPDLFLHLETHRLEIEVHFLQDVDRDSLAELDEPEQQVLGAHVVVVESICLLAG